LISRQPASGQPEMTWKTAAVVLVALAIGYGTLAMIAFGK
jgi:hypothetical protein